MATAGHSSVQAVTWGDSLRPVVGIFLPDYAEGHLAFTLFLYRGFHSVRVSKAAHLPSRAVGAQRVAEVSGHVGSSDPGDALLCRCQ